MKKMKIKYLTRSFQPYLQGPVVEVIKKLQDYVDKYPDVEIDTDQDEDGIIVELFYHVEETDEEYDARIKLEAIRDERQLKQRKAQYEALKKEFENK